MSDKTHALALPCKRSRLATWCGRRVEDVLATTELVGHPHLPRCTWCLEAMRQTREVLDAYLLCTDAEDEENLATSEGDL